MNGQIRVGGDREREGAKDLCIGGNGRKHNRNGSTCQCFVPIPVKVGGACGLEMGRLFDIGMSPKLALGT
jgi:hypothetical protein